MIGIGMDTIDLLRAHAEIRGVPGLDNELFPELETFLDHRMLKGATEPLLAAFNRVFPGDDRVGVRLLSMLCREA